MKAKEKAKELYSKFQIIIPMEAYFTDTVKQVNEKCIRDHHAAKQCALIAVEEIIKYLESEYLYCDYITRSKYWNKVKSEIEKL